MIASVAYRPSRRYLSLIEMPTIVMISAGSATANGAVEELEDGADERDDDEHERCPVAGPCPQRRPVHARLTPRLARALVRAITPVRAARPSGRTSRWPPGGRRHGVQLTLSAPPSAPSSGTALIAHQITHPT